MALPLRPTLGIQLAPPTVGCAAYLSITSGPPVLFAQALMGYGRGATGPIPILAPYLFAAANLVIGGIALGTLWLLVHGRLLPPPSIAAPAH
jgi:tellurite resistance protein